MKIIEAYKSINQPLNEKFDDKKAQKTLKDIQVVFAQAKYIGLSKSTIKRWNDIYWSTYTQWYSSKQMDDMGIPTELK